MKFSDLGLCEPVLRAIAAEGYATATPIQAQAIPPALEGRDVLGSAQTGTGKTAAFALPIIHRLTTQPRLAGAKHHVRALVLCPTRELAAQIGDSFRVYGRDSNLRHTTVYGGVNQNPQVQALRRGCDVLIATPGRLLDLMNQNCADLSMVEVLVLDEADRMMDMGFIHDIRRIITKLSARRQTLMFSATMPSEIRRLADTILRNPANVQVAPVATTAGSIEQSVYHVDKKNKPALLSHLFKELGMSRAIVFTRTKHGADRVVRHLQTRGIKAEAIHGNKSQNVRQRALANFKASKTSVLVATDIASRGIDVDNISHVVNFDISDEPEAYVHRIGRTARAGASGAAVSFCDPEERSNLRAIERLIRKPIEVKTDHPVYPARAEAAEGNSRRTPGAGNGRGSERRASQAEPRRNHAEPRHSHAEPRRNHAAPQQPKHQQPRYIDAKPTQPARRTAASHPLAAAGRPRQVGHGNPQFRRANSPAGRPARRRSF